MYTINISSTVFNDTRTVTSSAATEIVRFSNLAEGSYTLTVQVANTAIDELFVLQVVEAIDLSAVSGVVAADAKTVSYQLDPLTAYQLNLNGLRSTVNSDANGLCRYTTTKQEY